jgi:hypothetical protein
MRTAPLVPPVSAPSYLRPLLVLDAGEFLAQCRWCGWKSTCEPTPDEAWAAFAAHACEEHLA